MAVFEIDQGLHCTLIKDKEKSTLSAIGVANAYFILKMCH